VTDLAHGLAALAGEQGKEGLTAMLPPVPAICDSFAQAGYTAEGDGSTMYIYALDLS
jgi:hypothetical protein